MLHSNPLRSERTIRIGSSEFILKPSFDSLARIESATGRSIFAVLQDLGIPRACKITELVTILECGIQAGARKGQTSFPSRDEIGSWLMAGGLASVLPIVIPWLGEAIATDEDLEKARDAKVQKSGEVRSPVSP